MVLKTALSVLLLTALSADAFVGRRTVSFGMVAKITSSSPIVSHMSFDDSFPVSIPSATQERIQSLVDEYPVLLFMKGSKLFPQCGFSNTATQILQSFGIDFHTVGM
jgi:hypothetical protein